MTLAMGIPVHIPVLKDEVVSALDLKKGRNYIDATVGLGGHSSAILHNSEDTNVLGFDLDPEALEIARMNLVDYQGRINLVNSNYVEMSEVCKTLDFKPIHGILLDLGLSSVQLDKSERGFSFKRELPLDMRYDPNQELTAGIIVNSFSEIELASIIWRYGEERLARHVARAIVRNRPLATTLDLANIVEKVYGSQGEHIHAATRTFMALRIAVNDELRNLSLALNQTKDIMPPGGRLVVISYHSLEDRIVKEFLRRESSTCICPPEVVVCQCNHQPTFKIIAKKVIKPSLAEVALNPRSRSARLRIAERINHINNK